VKIERSSRLTCSAARGRIIARTGGSSDESGERFQDCDYRHRAAETRRLDAAFRLVAESGVKFRSSYPVVVRASLDYLTTGWHRSARSSRSDDSLTICCAHFGCARRYCCGSRDRRHPGCVFTLQKRRPCAGTRKGIRSLLLGQHCLY